MKLNKLATALTALAAVAVLTTSAQAQVFPNYNSGDVFIGFEQSGAANDYIADIGSVSQFIGDASPVTIQLSTTDLTAAFGSSWASNSNSTTNVQWGLVANDQSDSIASDTDGSSIWYTKGETVVGTKSAAPIRGTSSALNAISNKIQALETATTGGYTDYETTADTSNGVIESSTAANSWTSFKPGTYSGNTAFNIGSEIEQPSSGNDTGPTDSALDFYEVDTRTASNQPATLLGTFSLSNSGLLTFNPAAVPEPSSYALGLTALVIFFVLKRRKALSNEA